MNNKVNAITKYEIMLATACITGLEGILSAVQFEDDFVLEETNRTLLPIIEPQINFIERVIDETNEEESYKLLVTAYAKVLLASYDVGFLTNLWRRTYITEKLRAACLTTGEKNQFMEEVKNFVIRLFNQAYETEILIDICLNAHECIFG